MFHTAVWYGVGVWGPVQRHVCCTAYMYTAVLIRQDIVLVFIDKFHGMFSNMYRVDNWV